MKTRLNAAATRRKTRPDANLVCAVRWSASPAWFRDDRGPDGRDPKKEPQQQAITRELMTTANLVLNLAQSNDLDGRTYVFSRRRGFTKIDRRDGTCLVHDQGGTPTLTADFQASDRAKIAPARDTLLFAIAQQYEQTATQRSKRR